MALFFGTQPNGAPHRFGYGHRNRFPGKQRINGIGKVMVNHFFRFGAIIVYGAGILHHQLAVLLPNHKGMGRFLGSKFDGCRLAAVV